MDFENVAFTKCVHGYVIKGIMYNINDIKSIFMKTYLHLTCNVQLGIQNTNYKL
jgi:hypothetical protein